MTNGHFRPSRRGPNPEYNSVTTDRQNNVKVVSPGDDIQSAIDTVHVSGTAQRGGMVRFKPNVGADDQKYDFSGTSLPVTVKEGVRIDARGAHFAIGKDSSSLFDMRPNTRFLGEGLHIWDGGTFTGTVWLFDADQAGQGNREAAEVLGFPRIQSKEPLTFEFKQTTGNSLASILATAHGYNGGVLAKINSTGAGGFISNNEVWAKGSWDGNSGANPIIEITGGVQADFNRFRGVGAKIKGTPPNVVKFDNPGNSNRVVGNWIDTGNATNPVEWTSSAGPDNKVPAVGFDRTDFVESSGKATNVFVENYFPFYLIDDWSDNQLSRSSATEQEVGNYVNPEQGVLRSARYHPDWTTETGSPSASGGQLVLGDGSTTTQGVSTPTDFTVGEWVIEFVWSSDPTSGRLKFRIISDSGSTDFWQVPIEDDGQCDLEKVDSGSFTDVINGTWGDDLNEHVVRVTRTEDGEWELFVDGTSQGTTTDTFLPSTIDRIEFRNNANAEVSINRLEIK